MCRKNSWGAIAVPKEAHSTQRGQPPRMHGPDLWRYERKEQRVTLVPMIGVNCDLWCPGWGSKDLGGRPEQDPGYTSRPWLQYGIWSATEAATSGVHQAFRQIRVHSLIDIDLMYRSRSLTAVTSHRLAGEIHVRCTLSSDIISYMHLNGINPFMA